MMEIIRLMTHSDIDAVYALETATFSMPWSKEALLQEVNMAKAFYLVAEVRGTIVGYGGLRQIYDEGHITNIAVSTAFRRQGIGTRLVKQLIKENIKQGIRHFTLEVRQSNKKAIALYKKMGFTTLGIRKNYYDKPREHACIMWLDTINSATYF